MESHAGIIILYATLAVFVSLGVGFLTHYVANWNKWQWPPGVRTTESYGYFTAHLIHPAGMGFVYSSHEVARRAALAAQALYEVVSVNDQKFVAREFVVHVLPDVDYNIVYNPGANGLLSEVRTKTGRSWMPLLACRRSAFDSTPETGSLVVHELVHNVIRDNNPSHAGDRPHSDDEYWYPNGVEAAAFKKFEEIITLEEKATTKKSIPIT